MSHLKSKLQYGSLSLQIVSNAFRETMVLFQSAGEKGILYGSDWLQFQFIINSLHVYAYVSILLRFLPIFLQISFLNILFHGLFWKE